MKRHKQTDHGLEHIIKHLTFPFEGKRYKYKTEWDGYLFKNWIHYKLRDPLMFQNKVKWFVVPVINND